MPDDVEEQRENNERRPGGITGKGFQPGQSGNPGGRPKGSSVTSLLREILQEEVLSGKTRAELLARAMLKLAIKGKPHYMAEIMNRVEGKVPDRQAHEGQVTIRVEYADADDPTPPPPSGPA